LRRPTLCSRVIAEQRLRQNIRFWADLAAYPALCFQPGNHDCHFSSRQTLQVAINTSWIMMRSATDLSKADLHVFPKLFDDGLERGQEAEAFSWRQIDGHDDVLDFFVGHLINVGMTRQPAP